jgi:hypothetical protein
VSIGEVLSRLEKVRENKRGWMALCPAHDDTDHRSLSIAEGDDGRVLLNCFAGCTANKITAALGLKLADLFPGDRDDLFTNRRQPRTLEERQAADNARLRRKVRALELDRRRFALALGRASLIIAIAFHDDHEGVVQRLWSGAVNQLEREASAAADAYGEQLEREAS